MPFNFLALYKAKAYRAIIPGAASSSSPSSDSNPPKMDCPEKKSWAAEDNNSVLYYDPPSSAASSSPSNDGSRAAAVSASSSPAINASTAAVCFLPGSTPAPTDVVADDLLDDADEEEADASVDEVRREVARDEFMGTADATTVCDGRSEREKALLGFYGADEDAVELAAGELDVDEGGGLVVVETLFDCDSELEVVLDRTITAGCRCESGSDDASWCTTDDIAASPTEETTPCAVESGKNGFVARWLGLGPDRTGASPPVEVPVDGLIDLVGRMAAEWADARTDADAASESGSPDGYDASAGTGSASPVQLQREFDFLLASMEAAEEGRATEMGPVTEMRHYGDSSAGEAGCIVIDRPSLDFLDRLEALERASLRWVRE